MKVVKYERNLAKRLPLGGKLARKRLMRGINLYQPITVFPKKESFLQIFFRFIQ